MRAYIIRRLLLVIPTLWMVTLIVFFTVRFIPGDVVDLMGEEQEHLTGKGAEIIRHELGLDVPVHIQYVRWMTRIITRGDFGDSLWKRLPVIDVILPRLPVSFEFGLLAIFIAQLIALPIGIFSAIRQDSPGDYIGRSIAIACIALPNFWIGTMIMVFPALWWGWSPPMEYVYLFKDPIANLQVMIIPAAIMGMVMSGTTMRMTRTMMLEVLRQDYIRTAWAKGLRERVVIMRHALKNALIPVVTIVGTWMPMMIGGTVIIELIFNMPGMGRLLLDAISVRDYTVISGIIFIYAITLVLVNLAVDLTYGYLDPRIRYK